MARLFSCPFELGTTNMLAEGFTSSTGPAVASVDATIARAGARSRKVVCSADFLLDGFTFTAVVTRTYFARWCIRFDNLPNPGDLLGFGCIRETGGTGCEIIVNPSGVLSLAHQSNDAAIINGPTVAGGTWYVVELSWQGNTGACELRVNGTSYGTATGDITANTSWEYRVVSAINVGNVTIWHDDCALNDNQGAAQNSWCGLGKGIVLLPTADSANVGFTPGHVGDALSNCVKSIPPTGTAATDTTTVNSKIVDATNNATDHYNATLQTYTVGGMGSGDTVVLAQPIVIHGNSTATSRSGGIQVTSNPVIGEVTGTTGAIAAATYPTGWTTLQGNVVYSPSVTNGTAPVIEYRKATASTDTAMACYAGLMVEFIGATNTDAASGVLTLGGSRTESKSMTNAVTGVLTLSGSDAESLRHSYYHSIVAADPGLVSYWRLDEASGNMLDSKGTNHGTQSVVSTLRLAGAGADDAAVGTLAWTNPGNITVQDTNYAECNGLVLHAGTTHYLKASSSGFTIPTGATIGGIAVTIRRSSSVNTATVDSAVRLTQGGVVQATSRGDTVTPWPNTMTSKTYGNQSDLWGQAPGYWTPAFINNAGFGVVLSATMSTDSDLNVDFISITVYYTTGITRQVTGLITADADTAISGDGTPGAVISVPDASSLNPSSQVTVEAWIKSTTADTLIGTAVIMGKSEIGTQYILTIWPPSSFIFTVKDTNGVNNILITDVNTLVPGTVQHVVGVYDAAGRMQVFVNGVSSGTPNRTPNANIRTTVGSLWFLSEDVISDPFQGTLDELALYNTALSPATIAAHYTAGLGQLQIDSGSGALILAGSKTESKGRNDNHSGVLTFAGSRIAGYTRVDVGSGNLVFGGTNVSATYFNITAGSISRATGNKLPFTEVWGRDGWI